MDSQGLFNNPLGMIQCHVSRYWDFSSLRRPTCPCGLVLRVRSARGGRCVGRGTKFIGTGVPKSHGVKDNVSTVWNIKNPIDVSVFLKTFLQLSFKKSSPLGAAISPSRCIKYSIRIVWGPKARRRRKFWAFSVFLCEFPLFFDRF